MHLAIDYRQCNMCLCLWDFSLSLGLLYASSVIHDIFTEYFVATWPAAMGEIHKKKDPTDPGMVFAYLQVGRGLW